MKVKLTEDELIQLESLSKSPVYAVLRKAAGLIKDEYMSVMQGSDEPREIYRAQGVIRGLEMVEGYPNLAEALMETKRQREAAKEKAKNQPKRSVTRY